MSKHQVALSKLEEAIQRSLEMDKTLERADVAGYASAYPEKKEAKSKK